METTTAELLAKHIGGTVDGAADRRIALLATIQDNAPDSLAFLSNGKYHKYLYTTTPRTILIDQTLELNAETGATLIRVENVYAAYAEALHWLRDRLNQEVTKVAEISPMACIDKTVEMEEDVTIGAYALIGKGTTIGAQAIIADHVSVGSNVSIGRATQVMSGVRIMDGVSIGERCIIYPNSVIGSDGFGHALHPDGHQKIVHSGSVIIEDDVEIGSNTVIDRGALTDTIIKKGAKLDNLIQIAHGVVVGPGVVIAAQSGISGSVNIGAHSMIGGQVGIAGHLSIAQGSKIQAQSGIASDITNPNRKWYGYPILSYFGYLRSYAVFKRLPELLQRIRDIENRIK